ncbi:hypothetical protein [Streptomyces sp. NBC_01006]|uniref:hypothetical protein n=1 Tax=Streptomyces sp. NBC_01006 TaxID=2903716 RepID=UPI003867F827|nr:hypothetical protein OG509_01290 [Streptomyces sp. NBC_01006]
MITDFGIDTHVTGLLPEHLAARHGHMAVSCCVRSRQGGTRVVVKVVVGSGDAVGDRVRRRLLAWGDLVMMRKQLVTLKKPAEASVDPETRRR